MEKSDSNLEMQLRVLEQALDKGLVRNEDQRLFWTKHKSEHEKVATSLNSFVQGLKVNCMVPLGSKALMKGTLIHTNEVLTSIGDGYFVKYSAHDALELCGRRIKQAEEMLQNLDKERDLFEMRKVLPVEEDAFGGEQTKEINEYWEQGEVDDWKKQHREKEKEYRQKLAEVRNREVKKIETEEDLFERLDQLELEEELADELNRHTIDDLSDDLSEEDASTDASDSDIQEEIQRELEKLKELRSKKSDRIPKTTATVEEFSEKPESSVKIIELPEKDLEVAKVVPKPKRVSFSDVKEEHWEEDSVEGDEEPIRIVFSHSVVNAKVSTISGDINTDTSQISTGESRTNRNSNTKNSASEINVNERKITSVAGSDNNTNDFGRNDSKVIEINSPANIHQMFNSYKSILKRREGDVDVVNREIKGILEEEEEEEEEEDEEEEKTTESVYESVVKDIKERNTETPDIADIAATTTTTTTRLEDKGEDAGQTGENSANMLETTASIENPIEKKTECKQSEGSSRPISKFRRERGLRQH